MLRVQTITEGVKIKRAKEISSDRLDDEKNS